MSPRRGAEAAVVLPDSSEGAEAGSPGTSQGEQAARWVTLREAAESAGVSVSALRQAYRKGRLDTQEEPGPTGPQKLVELGQVLERMHGAGGAPAGRSEASGALRAPPGMALVPVDAYERLLEQLGNLHQAGQELAEARERAGRAEEREAFLREQLAERRAEAERLRAELEAARSAAAPAKRRRWWGGQA